MDKFFHPASVAVVGASNRRRGYQMIKNLLYGYKGAIYPVNPNYKAIDEIPCFPSIEDIPNPVDMAIVLVPAPAVPFRPGRVWPKRHFPCHDPERRVRRGGC